MSMFQTVHEYVNKVCINEFIYNLHMNLVEKIKAIILKNCNFPIVLIATVMDYNMYDANKKWHQNYHTDSDTHKCQCQVWKRKYYIYHTNTYDLACPSCDTFMYCVKAKCDLYTNICRVSKECIFCDKKSCKHEQMINFDGIKVCYDCKNSIKKLTLENRALK